MDLPIHDEILWHACVLAERRLRGQNPIGDPRLAFPYLVRGSWMNDTNQVSPLLDLNTKKDVDAQQQVLFHGLWKLSLEDLFVRTARLRDGDMLKPHAAKILAGDTNVDGFGSYERFDHLDVVDARPEEEYDGKWATADRCGRAMTTQFTVADHIHGRLVDSTVDKPSDVRVDLPRLTILGRALHSVADFFSHSNYVELLLWSLAWKGELDKHIVDAFNHDDGSNDAGRPLFRCPLPAEGLTPAQRGSLLRNALLWYGPSPAETALVSGLFDLKDTTFSLLHIYAAHLVRTDATAQTDQMLDLAMAVFDVQGARLLRGAWKLFDGVSEVFRQIGQGARDHLANGINALAATREKQEREALEIAAVFVRKYNSKEAGEWARAGKLSYIARELQLEMAKGLTGQQAGAGHEILPHHSLIAKDHVAHEGGGHLRFKLACLLATEVTTDLLVWHFSKAPNKARYAEVARRSMIHPWRLFPQAGGGGGSLHAKEIATRVRAVDGSARWQRLALEDVPVLGATP